MELTIERDTLCNVWRLVTSNHGTHTYSFDTPMRAATSILAFRASGYTINGTLGIDLLGVPLLGKRYAIYADGTIEEQANDTLPSIRQ
jgi:hypothetical protein